MKAQTKFFVAGLFLVLCAAGAMTAAAQTSKSKLHWVLRVNETKGPIRAADVSSPLGKEAVSEVLGGPTNGADAAYLIYTRMPAGSHGPAMFTLPVDHMYLVLKGKMNIQIGTDKFVAGPNTGVAIPPGTPHHVWNEGPEPESHIEMIAPATSRDLMSMLKPAEARKVENASSMVRPAPPRPDPMKAGLNSQMLAERKSGFAETMRIDNSLPGSGGPKPHVHKFTQVYFEMAGSTSILYGLEWRKLPANSIYIVNPGTVHTNKNDTSEVETHLTFLLPEPPDRSEPFDIEVEFKGGVGAPQ
jgi:mannose-6-phosphate isomerase-like protein (cupin superfamily)